MKKFYILYVCKIFFLLFSSSFDAADYERIFERVIQKKYLKLFRVLYVASRTLDERLRWSVFKQVIIRAINKKYDNDTHIYINNVYFV